MEAYINNLKNNETFFVLFNEKKEILKYMYKKLNGSVKS